MKDVLRNSRIWVDGWVVLVILGGISWLGVLPLHGGDDNDGSDDGDGDDSGDGDWKLAQGGPGHLVWHHLMASLAWFPSAEG